MADERTVGKSPHLGAPYGEDMLLKHALERLPIQLARVGEHAAIVVVYGPHGFCDTHGKRQRNIPALMDWIGDLRNSLNDVERFARPYLFDFSHEAMRDIEASLSMIADEHGIETARAILRSAGVESVNDLSGTTFGGVAMACEAFFKRQEQGSNADEAMFVPPKFEAAEKAPQRSVYRFHTGGPVSREQVRKAWMHLRFLRGLEFMSGYLGVPQTPDVALNEGSQLSGMNRAKWPQYLADAEALIRATPAKAERDDDDF